MPHAQQGRILRRESCSLCMFQLPPVTEDSFHLSLQYEQGLALAGSKPPKPDAPLLLIWNNKRNNQCLQWKDI